MTERPILFSAPMVRALLAGTKTQTRRIVKPQPVIGEDGCWSWSPHRAQGLYHGQGGSLADLAKTLPLYSPYGVPGDTLWVREEFSGPYWLTGNPPREWQGLSHLRDEIEPPIWFWADSDPTDGDWTKPKPSIHMPRWASRITLRITDVRVERLNEISAEDARDEGVDRRSRDVRQMWLFGATAEQRDAIYLRACIGEYEKLWEQINGPGSWAANPWVWAVTFEVK